MRNPSHVMHAHKKQTIPKTTGHKFIYVASVAYPLTTIPQIVKIYGNQSAQDLSLLSWCLYMFFALVFLSYGLHQKLKPIILLESLWVATYTVVIVGILLYK
jgi:uncharacterized protein with PQ loop repeat